MTVTLICYDALKLPDVVSDGSIGLTVTSPPYNLGKPYGEYMSDDREWDEYLEFTSEWTSLVYRATVPGGRLCVNIPLDTSQGGRRPFYADFLGAVMAGWQYQTTIVWNEQNISRRTAWGSWARPTAPFVTAPVEMIVVLYKDFWKRVPVNKTWDIAPDDFKNWTLGMWTFPGESATRVGHPAPFPEELPRRLIHLYSFREDVILDPFVGSGTTCRVAEKLGRDSIGLDNNPDYIELGQRLLDAASVSAGDERHDDG